MLNQNANRACMSRIKRLQVFMLVENDQMYQTVDFLDYCDYQMQS